MAVKKNMPVQPLDPAVEAAMGDELDPIYGSLARRQQARTMTPGKRKKRERDRARTKITFDWPAWLIEQVTELAHEHGVPANQLAAVLVQRGLREVQSGKLNLREWKIPSRTPAFDWFLRVEKEDGR